MGCLLSLVEMIQDYKDFLAIIISIIIPIYILKKDDKRFREEMNRQRMDHFESLECQQTHHNEQLEQQENINRISIMPYFSLQENINIYIRPDNGYFYFQLTLINQGNGTAVEPYIEIDKEMLICETIAGRYYETDPLNIDIVKQDIQIQFEFCQLKNGDNQMLHIVDKIYFTIKFHDMMENLYSQKFLILIGDLERKGFYKVARVQSFKPELLEKAYK